MRYVLGLATIVLAACGAVDGSLTGATNGGGNGGATGGAALVEIVPPSTSSGTTSGTSTGGDQGSTTGGSPGTSTDSSTTSSSTTGSSTTGGSLPCCASWNGETSGGNGGGTTGGCTCEGACQAACGSTGTPLCFSFDEAPVQFVRAPGHFALADEAAGETDWITVETPWLVLDRDGDGRIDDGRELFGSMTQLPNGDTAKNGFEALRALDRNHDGRITPADAVWSRLRLWGDVNRDRVSQSSELRTLSSRGIEALELGFDVVPRCDDRGNCEVERAAFWYRVGGRLHRGRIVDVHLLGHPVHPGWATAGPTALEWPSLLSGVPVYWPGAR